MVMVLSPRAWSAGQPRPGAPRKRQRMIAQSGTSPSCVDSSLPRGLLEDFTLSQDWGLLRAGSLYTARTVYDRTCGQTAPLVRSPHVSPRLCPISCHQALAPGASTILQSIDHTQLLRQLSQPIKRVTHTAVHVLPSAWAARGPHSRRFMALFAVPTILL